MVVRLYADRIKPRSNDLGQRWMYVGLLAIPDDCHARALEQLQDARQEVGYCSEIHFKELKNRSRTLHGDKTAVAKRWTNAVLRDDAKIFHFYFLGINLSNLEHSAFGTGWDKPPNIYNRFFRSAVAYAIRGFFGSHRPITVSYVFHDKDDIESHGLFDWHTIRKLSSPEEGITFDTGRIQFIDSDHEKEPKFPQESHFIQLTDVLAGGMAHCLDATSKKKGCCEVAGCLLPLLERLTDPKRARNPNSRFGYFRRIAVGFFPSKRLSRKQLEDSVQKARSGFYIKRRLLLKERLTHQMTLL